MLPSSGPISFRDINVELGRPAGNWIDLNDAGVRALAGRPSGYIDFADLRGKSSSIFETFSFYVGEVGPQQIGDKVIISEPHRRGYFMYATDAYGYESARAGGLSPATYRGYTVDSMVEQHGTATVDTLQVAQVDRFVFLLNVIAGASFLKQIQIFYGSTLYFQFDLAGAAYSTNSGTGQTTWSWNLPASWHLTPGATYNVRVHYE